MDKTDYKAFARELVTTGELDPLYTMLYRARALRGDEWVKRFCMHMLMFYDVHGATVAAEHTTTFWSWVEDNYDTAKRGSERRYFRGEAGRAAIHSLSTLGQAATAFFSLSPARSIPDLKTRATGLKIVGFGDYFLLKWADLLYNVFLIDFDMSALPRQLPGPPLKCLKLYFTGQSTQEAMDEIVSWIDDLDDPFSGTRKCGYSEAETIACAIPSYLYKKRYSMGDDIAKYRNELRGFPQLQALLP